MNKEQADKIIQSKLNNLVSGPGAYNLRVSNVTLYDGRFIVNFSALTPYQAGKLKELYKAGNLDAAVNVGLSGSVRPTDYVPSKGETVKVTLGMVDLKDGSGQGLMVTGISEIKAVATKKVDLADFFGDTEEEEDFTVITQEADPELA